MIFMQRIIHFFIFFFLAIPLFAQKNKTYELHFFITKIEGQRNDSVYLNIPYGWYAGINIGQQGTILARYNSEKPDRNSTLAHCRVESRNDVSTWLYAKEKDANTPVEIGDLVALSVELPDKQRSIFFELAALSIFFKDNYEFKDFYDIETTLDLNNNFTNKPTAEYKSHEDYQNKLLAKLLKDIHQVSADMRSQMEAPIVDKGKFKGQNLFDLMDKATTADLMSFLRFVRAYTYKYMGNSWRISETFATWLFNSSPLATEEVLEAFLKAKGTQAFEATLKKYETDLDEDFFDKLISLTETAIKNENWANAQQTLNLGLNIANTLKINDLLGKFYAKNAELKAAQGQRTEELALYQKAKTAYQQSGAEGAYLVFLNDFADKLNDYDLYAETQVVAEEGLQLVEKLLLNATEKPKTQQVLKGVKGLLFRHLGLSYLYRSNYETAKTQLHQSLQVFEGLDSTNTSNASRKATTLYYLGYTYYRNNLYGVSAEYYQKALDIYKNLDYQANVAQCMTFKGQSLGEAGQFKEAESVILEAVKIATTAQSNSQIAFAYNKLANLYKKNGLPAQAINAYNKATEVYVAEKKLADLATTYNDIAKLYQDLKDYQKAIEFLEKTLQIRLQLNKQTDIAESYKNLASIYYDLKNYAQAKIYYQKNYDLCHKIGDKSEQVYALANLGNIAYFNDNDFVKAENSFLQAITLAQQINDNSILAWCYRRISELYLQTGRAEKANLYSTKAIETANKLEDKTEQMSALLHLAYLSTSKGNFTAAQNYYKEVLTIAEQQQNTIFQASAHGGLAWLNLVRGEFENAQKEFDVTVDLYKTNKNDWGIANTYLDLANLKTSQGDYEQSKAYIHKADSLYTALNSTYQLANVALVLGRLQYFEGKDSMALVAFEKSTKILKQLKIEDENLCVAILNAAECQLNLKKYALADKNMQEGLAIAQKMGIVRMQASANTLKGKILLAQKKYEEAKKYFQLSLAVCKKLNMKASIAQQTAYLGEAFMQNKEPEKAAEFLAQAIEQQKQLGVFYDLWESLYWQGVYYRQKGDTEKAKTVLKEAIEIIEKLRNKVTGGEEARKLFGNSEKKTRVYEALVAVLLERGEVEEAFDYVQRNNADDLKKKYKDLNVRFRGEKKEAIEKERSLKAKIENIEEQIAKEQQSSTTQNQEKIAAFQQIKTIAETEYNNFVNFKINKMKDLQQYFTTTVRPIELRKSKELIPDDMALVSYLTGTEKLYIFVTTKEFAIGKEVNVSAEELKKLVNTLNNQIIYKAGKVKPLSLENSDAKRVAPPTNAPKQTDAFLKTCEQLYLHLIAPIHAEISSKKKLAIMPAGRLYYLPFQVIGKTLGNGEFSPLIEQHTIFYANSLEMLHRPDRTDVKNMHILAFGNPDGSLPAAENEVQQIKGIFPNTTTYFRKEATEDKAKDDHENFNVMHFATHGNLDYQDFSQSYLTMAENPSKNEDGQLTLEELLSLDLMKHFNLVVLSACKTAVADKDTESSPVSPASSFLQQGVRAVVASLWAVNDVSTSYFSTTFYENLKNNMELAEALRQAQVRTSQQKGYAHPFFWSPFILLGDWK